MTNDTNCRGYGQILGQNGADFHSGTMTTPFAFQISICLRTAKVRIGGGHTQLLQLDQFCVKQSTASVPGHQNRLLKRLS